jgi:hypothetical protein
VAVLANAAATIVVITTMAFGWLQGIGLCGGGDFRDTTAAENILWR